MNNAVLLGQFRGIDGVLGTRGSIMLDMVFVTMFLVLPALAWSIGMVRFRRNYVLHKRVQLVLASALLLAVGLFEIDMQFISGWRDRAEPSPYWPTGVKTALYVHLVFAVSTFFIWLYVVVGALRNIPNPPRPSAYSRRHIFWAYLAAIDLTITSITGWVFYWLAFVAV